jgi:rare lipoprotein A
MTQGRIGGRLLAALLFTAALAACAGPQPAARPGPAGAVARDVQVGIASWYGPGFHGRQTASGQRYDMYAMTAAHRSLPFGTRVQVTNLENMRSVVLTINDRGPFIDGRIVDVSKRAAQQLGFERQGKARVSLQVLASGG